MPGIDDRILRRNLASDRPIGSFNLNSGVNKSFFNGLHPNRNLMGNLSTSSLHRSMPSVNEQKINKEEEEKQKINNNNNNFRHLSLCYENKQNNKIINEENKKEINYNKNEKIRCASAHSFNSLTQNNSTNNIFTSNFCEQINSTPALDTKHIEFFLKKREDSQTTITTTLSDEIDILNNNSSQLKQQQQSIDILPQSSSSSTINNLNNNLIKLKSQKLFKSSDTRSSIFSVSSSLDSTKEEKIISNLEHLPNKIVILPRPNFSKTFQENNLNELKKEENNNNKIIELLNSSENQNIGLISPITHRRPSIDSNKNNLLSSWHSVSDFQNINKIIINNKNKTTLEINNKLNNNNNEIWRSPPIIRPQTQSGIRRSNYLGAIVWQVDETVYCGGIEAALNQNLLCRLNIEYIVDLSGQEDDPTFTNTRQLFKNN